MESTLNKQNPITQYLQEVQAAKAQAPAKEKEEAAPTGWLGGLLNDHNRLAVISVTIIIIGCLGGMAVGFGVSRAEWALALIVAPTMFTLSMILGVAPMKWIVYPACIAVLVDVLLITMKFV